mgnify:CR=1 FL=1
MDMKTKLAGLMAQCLTDTWPDAQGLPTAEEIRGLLAVPPDPKMGDYALPVFRLAKAMRMAPPKIATTVVEKWSHEDVARAEAVNGYVNFFLNRVNFAAETLESVLKAGENMARPIWAMARRFVLTIPLSISPSASISGICPPR